MKHGVSRKQSISTLSRKVLSEPEKSAAKTAKNTTVKSPKPNSVKTVSTNSKPSAASPKNRAKVIIAPKKSVKKDVSATISIKKNASPTSNTKTTAKEKQLNLKAKIGKIAPEIVGKATKVSARKSETKTAATKVKTVRGTKEKSPVKNVAQKIAESKPSKTAKAVRPTSKASLKPIVKAENASKTASPTARKKAKKIEKPSVKIRNGRLVLPPRKKVETAFIAPVETAAEPIKLPPAESPKRKLKSFGAAIFRGKKTRYDFQVFPFDGEFEDAAAIFIISRRKVDNKKRAHHRMVCIGQTDSVLDELKKHRKGKCFKQFQANAISILREENEQKRLKIEADLKSAHQIPCPH